MTTPTHAKKKTTSSQPSTIAVLSLIFGVVSLMGPGLLLGIPAVILAVIALKKDAAGRGLSIAGLVTGSISTFVSLLFIAFLILVFAWAANNADTFYDDYPQQAPAYHSSHT